MLDWMTFATTQVHVFALILMRVSAILMSIPIVGNRHVPAQVQIGLAVIATILLWPLAGSSVGVLPTDVPGYTLLAIRELGIGLVIGFAASLIFNAIYLAGQMIDMQMGFGIVNVIDPLSNIQIPIVGQFQYLIAILIFMAIQGHHWFVEAVVDSYRIIPIGQVRFSPEMIEIIWELARHMWIIAFKIAAPVLGLLFLSTVAMGIIARTVPQMNVFIVGFPLQIALGLFMLAAVLPMFYVILEKSFLLLHEMFVPLMKAMGPVG